MFPWCIFVALAAPASNGDLCELSVCGNVVDSVGGSGIFCGDGGHDDLVFLWRLVVLGLLSGSA